MLCRDRVALFPKVIQYAVGRLQRRVVAIYLVIVSLTFLRQRSLRTWHECSTLRARGRGIVLLSAAAGMPLGCDLDPRLFEESVVGVLDIRIDNDGSRCYRTVFFIC